jgi:N-acetyl-gamma-glutamyl-phosphate reductase
MISVGILGGSGYAGKKLLQFCNSHPFVSEYKVYGLKSAGTSLSGIFPELTDQITDSKVESIENISNSHDLYFIALPNGEALKYVPAIIKNGKKVIDLGGDYRLDTKEEYEKWYGITHTSSNLLNQKLYGLADYYGTEYSNINLIANPGCYPTATLLGLLPFAAGFGDEIISASTIAYSGTSGAGKNPKQELLMAEMDGDVSAYNVNKHRHQPEILQTLKKLGFNSPFSFTTHLLPASVGIYTTTSVHLKNNIDEKTIKNYYKSFYENSPFVRLRDVPPHMTWVINTNYCDINTSIKEKVMIITSTIDNLIKGASGQAVQNMNKLFGLEEGLGIKSQGAKNVSVY